MNCIAYYMHLCHIYLVVLKNLFKLFKMIKVKKMINNKMLKYYNKFYNTLY